MPRGHIWTRDRTAGVLNESDYNNCCFSSQLNSSLYTEVKGKVRGGNAGHHHQYVIIDIQGWSTYSPVSLRTRERACRNNHCTICDRDFSYLPQVCIGNLTAPREQTSKATTLEPSNQKTYRRYSNEKEAYVYLPTVSDVRQLSG
jgi:hypothetical protein